MNGLQLKQYTEINPAEIQQLEICIDSSVESPTLRALCVGSHSSVSGRSIPEVDKVVLVNSLAWAWH